MKKQTKTKCRFINHTYKHINKLKGKKKKSKTNKTKIFIGEKKKKLDD